jgi:hypothetical protein
MKMIEIHQKDVDDYIESALCDNSDLKELFIKDLQENINELREFPDNNEEQIMFFGRVLKTLQNSKTL